MQINLPLHSFARIFPSSQTTLVRVVTVKTQTSLVLARLLAALTTSNLLTLAAKTQTSLVFARLLAALPLCSLLCTLFSIFNPLALRALPLGKWESSIYGFGNSSSPSLRGGVGLPTEGRKCCVRPFLPLLY